jgi:HEAT repeat protein/Tfp pilus assembly protein PilF
MQAMAMKKRVNFALGIFLVASIAAILVAPRSREQLWAFVRGHGTESPLAEQSALEDAGREADRGRAKSLLGPLTGGTADIPGLLETLKDDDPRVREAAAGALARIGKPAIPALVEALKHDEPRVRFGATRALGLMKEEAKESIPALVDALDDQSSMVRFGPGWALVSIGTDSVPALIRGVKEPKQRMRYHSILVLSQLGSKAKDAIPALTAALSDKEISVRSTAAKALGAMGPIAKPAMPAILEAMKDKEPLVSESAWDAKKRIDPDDYDRGTLAMESRDYEGAIHFFNKVLGTNPGNAKYPLEPTQLTNEQKLMLEYLAQCHQNLAKALLKNEDFGPALEHLDKRIQLRPNDVDSLIARGKVYHGQLHDYVKALADYKRGSELLPKKDPKLATCYNNIAWILATCPRQEIRDGREAIKYATEACKLRRSPNFVETLAAAQAEAGNFEEAVRLLREALKHPDDFGPGELHDAKARLGLYESRTPYHEN